MTEPEPHRRRWWILGVLSLSLLTVVLDNTVLNVALPSLVRDLGASTAETQWIVNSYSLSQAGLLLTAGNAADRYGRKRALLFGLAVFGLGSAGAAFSATPVQLILTRAFMGIGGSFLMTTTLALVMQIFPDAERPRAIGVWAGVSALGFTAGPVVGGFMLDHAWWGSIFLINLPVAAVSIVAVILLVPESRNPTGGRPDLLGAFLSVAAMVGIVYAVVVSPEKGWGSGETLVPGLAGLLLMGVFIQWERHISHPMLSMSLFRDRMFGFAAAGGILVAFGMSGALFLLTQYLQFLEGFSPIKAGFATAPMAATVVVFNLTGFGARVLRRTGPGRAVMVGVPLIAVGTATAGFFVGHGYWGILVGLVLIGSGVGLAMPAVANSIMTAISRTRAGTGAGVNGTLQELGASLGVAVLGALVSARFASSLPDTLQAEGHQSLPATLAKAAALPGSAGLVEDARHAFVSGLSTSQLIGAALLLVGGLVVGRNLRRAERTGGSPTGQNGPQSPRSPSPANAHE
ncbi:MFS transporter [Streptomyces echinatus]|uniref:MFS transporter n=1 Tax=Streptomyces echinatus TaxID=67293 RepID=UPI0037A28CC4